MPNAPLEENTPEEGIPTPESDTQPPMTDTLAGLFQRVKELEGQVAQHVAPDAHNVLYAGLHERLTAVEQALTRIAGGSMQLHLGAPELEAIGNALRGHMSQVIFDVLKTHYGLNPPANR